MDHTQRGWALGSIVLLAVSTVVYVFYVLQSPTGPSGGSFMGLVFGISGFAFMIFAALLGARKRVPTWRLGRAQAWMPANAFFACCALFGRLARLEKVGAEGHAADYQQQ